MIDFYNAFISYRHAPLDSAIATHVQRKLEHFHVPHKLKKKLKREKITRIFRDKDELPITSDLTETITEALEKADYLIVICSTNTKDSIWVKREINTFLKTHSRDKVLTVLCDGEPFDVIPEELLTTEKEYVDENGFPHTVKVSVEPLSCDYRLPRSTADKEELPRLAAALLGCSYDELQRRSRQYRIRRTSAIISVAFAALIAFGAYMAYTGKKINDSYIDSLRSRSVYLANEAEQLMAEQKCSDALHMSLAALPNGEKDKMPVTAQAVHAITTATHAYDTAAGIDYTPIWNYKTEQYITNCVLSNDETTLAALDKSGNLYCWNTQNHELLFKKTGESNTTDIEFLGNDTILVTYLHRIEAFNIKTGSLIWSYKNDDAYYYEDYVATTDREVFIDGGCGKILRLSARDGSIKDTYQVMGDTFYYNVGKLAVSPDGTKIGYTDSLTFGTVDVHIYDTQNGKDYSGSVDSSYLSDLCFTDNSHLCVMALNIDGLGSVMYSDGISYIEPSTVCNYCFNMSMKQLWSSEVEYLEAAVEFHSVAVPARNAILFYIGNTGILYDADTGEELVRYTTGSAIVSASDFNNNGLPEFICRHGEYAYGIHKDDPGMLVYNVLCNNVKFGMTGEKIYAASSSSTDIICYARLVEDDELNQIKGMSDFSTGTSYQTFYSDEDYLIIASSISDLKCIRLSIVDLNSEKLVYTEDLTDYEGYLSGAFSIENIDGEIYGIFGDSIYLIDPEDSNCKKVDVETGLSSTVSNGKIIKCSCLSSELTLTVTDIDGSGYEEFDPYELEDISLFTIGDPCYLKELDKILIPVEDRMFSADMKTHKIKEIDLPEKWFIKAYTDTYTSVSEDGSLVLLYDENTVLVTDGSLKELYHFHLNYNYRYDAAFKDGLLYIIADDFLIILDANTGEPLHKCEIELWGTGNMKLTFDNEEHLLYLQEGDQVSVINTETYNELFCVKDAYCYHAASDRFYVYSYVDDTECHLGYYRHYTLDDLIAKANRLLDGQEMPEELKDKYGL